MDSTGKPASFMLDNNVATVVAEGTQNSVTQLSLGALALRGLPAGTHTLQHTKPLEGYRKNVDYQFSIDDTGTVSAVDDNPLYQVSDSTKTIAVSIKKSAVAIKNTDSSGALLGGANFELYVKDEKTPIFTGTVPQQGVLALDGVITGCARLSGNIGIPEVWYRLVQTKAPAGYQLNSDLYLFLGDDNTIYYSSRKPSANTLFTASGTEATLTVALISIDHSIIERPDPNKPLDTTKDAVFVFNGDYAKITEIRLNGHVLSMKSTSSTQSNLSGFPGYKPELGNIKSGSVIVTLFTDFLKSLPDSTYSLEVLFDDGEKGIANFEIMHDSQPTHAATIEQKSTSPKTGDDTTIILWVALCTIAGAGMAGNAMYRRKKERSTKI